MSKLENNSIPVNIADSIINELPKELFIDPSKKFCYASIVDDYIIRKLYDKLNEGLKDIIAGEAEPYTEFPAKATGNDHFDAFPGKNDWYETIKLNYGVDYCDAGGRSEHFTPVPSTWHKMLDILLYWAARGVDGFRCDMAEMVPTAFWSWAIAKVKATYPEILFVAEVYNPMDYRHYVASGFDYLYDKVGMYDTMRSIICEGCPTSKITTAWQWIDDINEHMLYFLENHDEQRDAGDGAQENRHHARRLIDRLDDAGRALHMEVVFLVARQAMALAQECRSPYPGRLPPACRAPSPAAPHGSSCRSSHCGSPPPPGSPGPPEPWRQRRSSRQPGR